MHGGTSSIGGVTGGATSPIPAASQNTGFTMGSKSGNSAPALVIAFLVMVAVYVAWAFFAAHEKARESLEAKNIAINLYNLALITFTVVVALTGTKIVLAKFVAWGVPGATTVLTVVDNA